MIKAIIFDLDGILIDSGPFWDEAEAAVLSRVGVPFSLELAKDTIGLRTDELVAYWHSRHPWQSPTTEHVSKMINDEVVRLIKANGLPKPGVRRALALCERLSMPIGVASSSPTVILEAALEALDIIDRFSVVHSAELEPAGKPNPAVYISAARKMGIEPTSCLAIEDSLNGIAAAKAAGMFCIAVPVSRETGSKRYIDRADAVIGSLVLTS